METNISLATTLTFGGELYSGKIYGARYGNGAPALVFRDRGQVIAKLTVNLVNEELKPGEVFIKSYSENKGLIEQLVARGWVYVLQEMTPAGSYRCQLRDLLRMTIDCD